MYQLVVYIPVDHLEKVKSAIFAAGAGRYAGYDCCAWQVLGKGQFRPLKGSKPFIGQIEEVVWVDEYRVEMICSDERLPEVIDALKLSHPYEEPAFSLIKLSNLV